MSIFRHLVVAFLCWAPAQIAADLPLAPPDVQAFVQQALEGRLNARDIPDFGVVRNQRQFVIRQEMPRAKQRLSKSALPEGTAFELSLRSISDIQAQADATNQDLLILIVDQPEMYGDNASVWLGTDIVLHHQSERKIMKTCCGIGRADFRRNGTTWVFVRWTGVAIA